jgi:RNA polymerase sigma factor (sigma-70 family)
MRFFRAPFEQEEAVQEALLQVFKAREQIDPLRADTLTGWVMTVAQRKMIDLVRASSARLPTVVAEEEGDEVEAVMERTAEDEAHGTECVRAVAELEARLKPAWRPYFHAVFVEGRDFDEAREALGIGRLRAKYLKKVLLARLRRHAPLLELMGRRQS